MINLAIISLQVEFQIFITTLFWSLLVATISTIIGWPLGIQLAQSSKKVKNAIVMMLFVTLAIPGYAIFYAWWQLWPAGTIIHNWLIENNLQILMTKACLFGALIGWSWPIVTLISLMTNRFQEGQSILASLDRPSLFTKIYNCITLEWRTIFSAFFIIAAITATNTTCFDLAQIKTVGNELRAVLASGGSIFDMPFSLCIGFSCSIAAAFLLLNVTFEHSRQSFQKLLSAKMVLGTWLLLSALPLILVSVFSLRAEGFIFVKYYKGDLAISVIIASCLVAINIVLFLCSVLIHAFNSESRKNVIYLFDFLWIFAALLPSSILVEFLRTTFISFESIYQTQIMVVIGQWISIGFIGVLAGRWVVESANTKTLLSLDGKRSIFELLVRLQPRIFASMIVVSGLTIGFSLSELAMTSQLSPPATNQPIAGALLNAMHYQRPQVITSLLAFFVLVAIVFGALFYILHRKLILFVCASALLVSCRVELQQPIEDAQIIGGIGISDGRFNTPRAIDANDNFIAVVDRSGRMQIFTYPKFAFERSWKLPLTGRGFPTGVSIDSEGLIWIPDTHGQRILVYTRTGKLVKQFGSYGISDSEFIYPTDVAFSDKGDIYVSEYGGNDRVSIFKRDGSFVSSFGSFGEGQLEFKRPQAMAVHELTGDIYIADSANHRIVVYSSKGDFIEQFGSAGRAFGELLYPYGITFIDSKNFIVSEYGNNRLQIFNTKGESQGLFSGAGTSPGLLKTPWAIVKTKSGFLIADTGNNRLQVLPDMMSN